MTIQIPASPHSSDRCTGDPAPGLAPRVLLRDGETGDWLWFANPCRVLVARRISEVLPALRRVDETVTADGFWAAGFISYEAAPALDPALTVRPETEFPLLWFALYREPPAREPLPPRDPLLANRSDHPLSHAWQPSITEAAYHQAIALIHEAIRRGHTYQVNFTYRLRTQVTADLWQIFLQLAAAQEPPYGAFVDTGDWVVCSASPELFFRLDGTLLESRPMKGTAARGLSSEEDRRQGKQLRESAKERAENVMIVDMVRNDLGRVAEPGSVQVPTLFGLEKYPTVWQMTSTVSSRTHASLDRIFQALFPPASVTGAPKPRTMQIISQLESAPRRLYTGSLGFAAPGRRAQFNVAIRTLLVHRASGQAEYGVGGGIVWDSDPAREFTECRVKSRILSLRRPNFELLETLRWTPTEGYGLLEDHLERLAASADYFGFRMDPASVRRELERLASRLPPVPHKVRLLVSRRGAATAAGAPLGTESAGFQDLIVAGAPVDRSDPFLYHKTTNRRAYEEALATRPGAADVLLYNDRREVTESTVANLVVDIDGQLCTPPVSCGLLPGTHRAVLLRQGTLRERCLSLQEVLTSPNVFLVNSVRGLHRVRVLRSA